MAQEFARHIESRRKFSIHFNSIKLYRESQAWETQGETGDYGLKIGAGTGECLVAVQTNLRSHDFLGDDLSHWILVVGSRDRSIAESLQSGSKDFYCFLIFHWSNPPDAFLSSTICLSSQVRQPSDGGIAFELDFENALGRSGFPLCKVKVTGSLGRKGQPTVPLEFESR